jgi:hypothetical protein
MDFDYKKYSLENLEKWMSDALTSSEATPQEIYDVIKGVVDEEYHYHKHQTGRCYELLALLNGNGKGHLTCDEDNQSEECKNAWTSFWEENYYPEEYKGSTVSSVQYTEEELNAMCDKAASDQEKEKCREYNLREVEYYDKRAQLDAKQDKVVKWQLPVEIDGLSGEYYVNFPDDLMEASGIKENDMVEWVNRGDGSYLLRKVTKPIGMEEC